MPSEPSEADLIDRLVRHGLGQGEARCYVAMLAPRAFKVSEVARRAGLPRSRTYELIRSLVRTGLCSEVAGGGVARFRAAPPNEAIGRLEAFLGEQARRRSAALTSIVQALDGRSPDGHRGAHDDPVETLSRLEQVRAAYDRMLRETKREVVCAVTMPWTPVHRPAAMECLAGGARFRVVHERRTCASEQHRDFVAFYCARGVEARVVDTVGVQFGVFDGRRIILHLPDAGSQLESLLIAHGGLGQTMYQAFECLWERGIPFEKAVRQTVAEPLAGTRQHPRRQRELARRGPEGRFVADD